MKVLISRAALLILLFAQAAYADPASECRSVCLTQFSECNVKANEHVNDLDVQDAKSECYNTLLSCTNACEGGTSDPQSVPIASGDEKVPD